MAMDTPGRITITQRAPLASQTRSWERSTRASDVMLGPHDAEKFRQQREASKYIKPPSPRKEKNTGEALGNTADVPPDLYLRPPEGIWEVSSAFFSNKVVHP